MTTHFTESAVVFDCEREQLVGIVHLPDMPMEIGVVIIVGGPQYRVGSHRQFLLLARSLAAAGFATLRFDYRGMGDSDGILRGFELIATDVRTAIDQLTVAAPSVKRVVLWGLCDGATAAGFYAAQDPRVAGLVLLNPWVRSQQSLARSLLFHYYFERATNGRAWRKLLTDTSALKAALHSLVRVTHASFVKPQREEQRVASAAAEKPAAVSQPLLPRLSNALVNFRGPILLVLSGADITANEFVEGERSDRRLRRRLGASNVTRQVLAPADHTFSRAQWRDHVATWTVDWLCQLAAKCAS